MEGVTSISATGVDEMWLCLGVLGPRSSPMKRVDLCSGITNSTSLRTSFARELLTKPKQDLSQKNLHTHGPTGTIAGGAHNRTVFLCGCFFVPCITGVLVLDLACSAMKEDLLQGREYRLQCDRHGGVSIMTTRRSGQDVVARCGRSRSIVKNIIVVEYPCEKS